MMIIIIIVYCQQNRYVRPAIYADFFTLRASWNLKNNVNLPYDLYKDVKFYCHNHCVKSVRIWSYSGLYFPAFGLNTVVRISPYSVQMRENTDQNNSEYGHFLRSEYKSCSLCTKILSHSDQKSLIYFLSKSKTVFRKELFCEKIKKWKADRCPYMLWKTCTVILSFVHID